MPFDVKMESVWFGKMRLLKTQEQRIKFRLRFVLSSKFCLREKCLIWSSTAETKRVIFRTSSSQLN